MTERSIAILIIATVLLAILGWQVLQPVFRRRRRARLLAQPLSADWVGHIARNLPLVAWLPAPQRSRLEGLVNAFMDEKQFVGCNGLQLHEEMAVTIAAQACLLITNRDDGCFDSLRQVLVYPEAFYIDQDHVDENGVVHRQRLSALGESWDNGKVIVSWQDAREGARLAADGVNVVIHEFAHQLDGDSGDVNGAPVLAHADAYSVWAETMSDAFGDLRARSMRGQRGVIDTYGATNPAEFFAVCSEVFFERPLALRAEEPLVYQRMREFYRQDPAAWQDQAQRERASQ